MNGSSWSTSARSSASTAASPSCRRAASSSDVPGRTKDRRGRLIDGSSDRNCDDALGEVEHCDGSTPSTRVTSVPMVIASVVNAAVSATTCLAPAGGR